jgi:hypothetical protein
MIVIILVMVVIVIIFMGARGNSAWYGMSCRSRRRSRSRVIWDRYSYL